MVLTPSILSNPAHPVIGIAQKPELSNQGWNVKNRFNQTSSNSHLDQFIHELVLNFKEKCHQKIGISDNRSIKDLTTSIKVQEKNQEKIIQNRFENTLVKDYKELRKTIPDLNDTEEITAITELSLIFLETALETHKLSSLFTKREILKKCNEIVTILEKKIKELKSKAKRAPPDRKIELESKIAFIQEKINIWKPILKQQKSEFDSELTRTIISSIASVVSFMKTPLEFILNLIFKNKLLVKIGKNLMGTFSWALSLLEIVLLSVELEDKCKENAILKGWGEAIKTHQKIYDRSYKPSLLLANHKCTVETMVSKLLENPELYEKKILTFALNASKGSYKHDLYRYWKSLHINPIEKMADPSKDAEFETWLQGLSNIEKDEFEKGPLTDITQIIKMELGKNEAYRNWNQEKQISLIKLKMAWDELCVEAPYSTIEFSTSSPETEFEEWCMGLNNDKKIELIHQIDEKILKRRWESLNPPKTSFEIWSGNLSAQEKDEIFSLDQEWNSALSFEFETYYNRLPQETIERLAFKKMATDYVEHQTTVSNALKTILNQFIVKKHEVGLKFSNLRILTTKTSLISSLVTIGTTMSLMILALINLPFLPAITIGFIVSALTIGISLGFLAAGYYIKFKYSPETTNELFLLVPLRELWADIQFAFHKAKHRYKIRKMKKAKYALECLNLPNLEQRPNQKKLNPIRAKYENLYEEAKAAKERSQIALNDSKKKVDHYRLRKIQKGWNDFMGNLSLPLSQQEIILNALREGLDEIDSSFMDRDFDRLLKNLLRIDLKKVKSLEKTEETKPIDDIKKIFSLKIDHLAQYLEPEKKSKQP